MALPNEADHSDRDDPLQPLAEAYAHIEQHDSERRSFLARAVHDLCTPLTVVGGYCGLLLEGVFGPLTPAQQDALHRIERNADRLSRTVTASLDLARPEACVPGLHDDSIEECIQRTLIETRSALGEWDLACTVKLVEPPPSLCFDANQIQYVLLNVIENARDCAPPEGSIEITGYPFFWERRVRRTELRIADRRSANSTAPNVFRIDVRDRGAAIPEEVIASWFDVFCPLSEGRAHSTGLGLAISKMMARAHRGDLWAASDSDGIVFSLVIPLQVDACGRDVPTQHAWPAVFSEL